MRATLRGVGLRQGNPKVSQGSLARVLGADHRATMAQAKAAITMDKADLWQARLALKTLRWDQREAIAEAAEG